MAVEVEVAPAGAATAMAVEVAVAPAVVAQTAMVESLPGTEAAGS